MNMLITEIVSQAIYFAVIVGLCVVGYHILLKRGFNLPQKKNNTGERFASQTKPIIGGTIFFICIVLAYIYCTVKGMNEGELPTALLYIAKANLATPCLSVARWHLQWVTSTM